MGAKLVSRKKVLECDQLLDLIISFGHFYDRKTWGQVSRRWKIIVETNKIDPWPSPWPDSGWIPIHALGSYGPCIRCTQLVPRWTAANPGGHSFRLNLINTLFPWHKDSLICEDCIFKRPGSYFYVVRISDSKFCNLELEVECLQHINIIPKNYKLLYLKRNNGYVISNQEWIRLNQLWQCTFKE